MDRPYQADQRLADGFDSRVSTNAMLGIGLKIASVCVFVTMASMLKAAEGIPPGQLVFFRSLFAIFPIILFLGYKKELIKGFKTKQPFGHVWRGLIGVIAMSLGFYGLTKLPLPESTSINYATPLLIVVFSAVFLKERVRAYRWTAVVIGLVGVLIIMWPRLSIFSGGGSMDNGQALGAISTLIACGFAACAGLLVRKLVQSERTSTIVLYFSITSTLFAALSSPFGWVWPTGWQMVLLVAAGISGGIAQLLLTESYRHAEMSVIAPFEYTSMILALIIGYLAFGDVPTIQMIIGGTIVVGAGIYIILREHQLGLERTRAKQASSPQG